MKFLVLFILIVTSISTSSWAQFTIEGIVLQSEDSSGIPGVLVYKDSLNKTTTDINGKFYLTLEDKPDSLTFVSVGYVTRTIAVSDQTDISVFMKYYALVHYFDSQNIGLFISSGVLNMPIGGELHLTSPFIFDQLVVKGLVNFQSNLKGKRLLAAQFDLDYIVATQYFGLDLKAEYRDVIFKSNLEFQTKSIETELRAIHIPFNIILGYSALNYSDEELSGISDSGPLLGLEHYFRRLDLSVTGKVVIYDDIVDYKAEVSKRLFRGINTFVRYHLLRSYSELTLGVGYKFLYIFNDPNKY